MAALKRRGDDGVRVSSESTYSGTYVIARLRGDLNTELYLLPEEALELADELRRAANSAFHTQESFSKREEL